MRRGFHSFNGPERDFHLAGAPTNPARRPVTTDRRWARHRNIKVNRAQHTVVQYNGMKYQKGLKPPPREVTSDDRRPMTTGFVPRVKSRPMTQPHRKKAASATGMEDLFYQSQAAKQTHWSQSSSRARSQAGRAGLGGRANEGGHVGGGGGGGARGQHYQRASSSPSTSPRRPLRTNAGAAAARRSAFTGGSRKTVKPAVKDLGGALGGVGQRFGCRTVWGNAARTPAELVAEIRREKEQAMARKVSGMAHSNATSMGNTMPGTDVVRSGAPRTGRNQPLGGYHRW